MNYFAHACVALRLDPDRAFVLGAMLPDFAHMIGARIRGVSDERLARGEAHHHRCDHAFHRAPTFRSLVMEATRRLDAEGVSRGASRGAAHVGIELMLDAALAHDAESHDGYREALQRAPGLAASIRWSRDDAPLRFQRLQQRLRQAGSPRGLGDPQRLTERLARALAPRPRLALAPHEHRIVQGWVDETQTQITRSAESMLEETLAGVAGD